MILLRSVDEALCLACCIGSFCMDLLFQNLKSAAAAAAALADADNQQQPEVVNVTFSKINNSLGLSIVAAKVRYISVRLPSCIPGLFSLVVCFCIYDSWQLCITYSRQSLCVLNMHVLICGFIHI